MKLNEKCMEIVNQVINAGKCHHLAKYNCLDLVDERTINEVVLPVLLFWDPIEQPCRTLLCPLCHQDGNQNVPLRRPDNPLEGWENCSSNSMMPRTIWDINWYMGLVKLDLFHAVQRLTKTISKRHPFCKDLCNQLTLVFRDKNDTGEERTMPTPNPTQIIENMERFIKNWNTVSYKGWKILQESFFMKWENLKVHVLLGCLSGIPVGHGTNKNENLHRQMRIILPRNRLGIDTANALFNSIFYYHNEKKKTVDRNGKAVKIKHVQPIWKFAGKDHQPIGISDMPLNNNVDFDKPFEIESLMDDNLAISEHADHDAYNLTQALPARTRRIINIANQFKQIKSKMDSDLLYRMFGTKGYASIPADIWHPRDFLKKHSIDDSFPLGSILKIA
ncbi:uncharacterized protein [Clytia hemisphaerica]|uniref:uncharacterized protein n=1 Tax=Clytia hemisphaerica TaxID=252671 RepID=UPI0034D400E4